MNFFIIDDKKIIIKELTVEEQLNFEELEIEDFMEKEKFIELYNQFIINKNIFDIINIDDETKEAVITAIIRESNIKKYGDFYILKTFDKINSDENKIFSLLFKQLKQFGYRYSDIKNMSQQNLIETFMYESVYNGEIGTMNTILAELNEDFQNERLQHVIKEFEKIIINKNINNPNVKSGYQGLANMK